ncbi:uncharacterized protein LOC119590816 [Penaeus monodon]|uniref:uncharacterized protein LOC119590816 n=1 Tax=Penaeus monodon TaxID=6687 RepID=UPI0018A73301|nr:uncharacterized protein LOC119590816 [Penaeus monodon]
MNKPLPRRKPQLTAPKLTLSDGSFRGAGRNDEFSSGKPSVADSKAPGSPAQKGNSAQIYKPSHTFTSPSAACIAAVGFGVNKTTKGSLLDEKVLSKSSVFSDDDNSDGSDNERSENTKKLGFPSSVDDTKQLLPVSMPKLSENNLCRSEVISVNNKETVQESCTSEVLDIIKEKGALVSETKCEKSITDEDKISNPKCIIENKGNIPLHTLKVEETRTVSFQPYKRGSISPPEKKCDLTSPRWDECDKEKAEEARNKAISLSELEERRREKEKELNREFDRLLSSTKSSSMQQSEQKTVVLGNDFSKHPVIKETVENTTKFNKVYDVVKLCRSLNYSATANEINNWQNNKVGKKEKFISSVDHFTQPLPAGNRTDSEDLNLERSRAKVTNNTPTIDKPESLKVDEKSSEISKELPEKSSNDKKLSMVDCSEVKLGAEPFPEKKNCRDQSNERKLHRDANIEKKVCKEVQLEKNVSKESSTDKTSNKELYFEKKAGKASAHERKNGKERESSAEKRSNKDTNPRKTSKDNSFEKKSSKEIDLEKKLPKESDVLVRTGADVLAERKITKETSQSKKVRNEVNSEKKTPNKDNLSGIKNQEISEKVVVPVAIDFSSEKKVKKDSNEMKSRDGNLERKSSKDNVDKNRKIVSPEKKTRDSSQDKKSSKESHQEKTSLESVQDKKSGRDVHLDKDHIKDVYPEKNIKDPSPEKKSTKDLSLEKKSFKDSSLDKKLVREASDEKRTHETPEKKPGKIHLLRRNHIRMLSQRERLLRVLLQKGNQIRK